MKNIYFRCDSSETIGIGHFTRCLTIADDLARQGFHCIFITSESSNELLKNKKMSSFKIIKLPFYDFSNKYDTLRFENNDIYKKFENDDIQNILSIKKHIDSNSIVILDHYLLGLKWQINAKNFFRKVVVIDDLLNTNHNCDLIIDPNMRDLTDIKLLKSQYKNIPVLSGINYLIVRKNFLDIRQKIKKKLNLTKKHIDCLIMFGGLGDSKLIYEIVSIICGLPSNIISHVIIGENNKQFKKIRKLSTKQKNLKLYGFTEDIHLIMEKCDIAVGALGTTTWERCYIGLPALVIVQGHNQQKFLKYLVNENIVYDLGYNVEKDTLLNGFKHFKVFDQNGKIIRKNLMGKIDGYGVKRITKEISNLYL